MIFYGFCESSVITETRENLTVNSINLPTFQHHFPGTFQKHSDAENNFLINLVFTDRMKAKKNY
jgi:hypothetical protein